MEILFKVNALKADGTPSNNAWSNKRMTISKKVASALPQEMLRISANGQTATLFGSPILSEVFKLDGASAGFRVEGISEESINNSIVIQANYKEQEYKARRAARQAELTEDQVEALGRN